MYAANNLVRKSYRIRYAIRRKRKEEFETEVRIECNMREAGGEVTIFWISCSRTRDSRGS